ncbi:MAG: hypothetical protein ACI9VX_002694 [Dinoroseobacter sp.]|jgi:hypothetical protein
MALIANARPSNGVVYGSSYQLSAPDKMVRNQRTITSELFDFQVLMT